MRTPVHTGPADEIAGLQASIDDEAAATASMLRQGTGPERQELRRQLAALHRRVSEALADGMDPLERRAELATLLSFARMLRADAEAWRAAAREQAQELERRKAAAREERQRLAAEAEALRRRRQALQTQLDQTALRMVGRKGDECRRTLPVVALGDGLTVSSMTVSSRRRKLWLVTLNSGRDAVLVRRG